MNHDVLNAEHAELAEKHTLEWADAPPLRGAATSISAAFAASALTRRG